MMNREEYDSALTSTNKSRWLLDIATGHVNFALRSFNEVIGLHGHPEKFTAYTETLVLSTIMMLSFAFEIAMKGKLDNNVLREVGIPEVSKKKEGHDLESLFSKMPKAEQEQLKMVVNMIMLISEDQFHDLLKQCKDAFYECRYFYEERNAQKRQYYINNCFKVIKYLYCCVYYLLTNEGHDAKLEDTPLKEYAYIGDGGFFYRREEIVRELEEAKNVALEEGNGTISETDREWINGIEKRLEEANDEIRQCQRRYREMHR